ncbi:MAG: DUF4230 domain-containing protein [Mobilitalea sp.]
MKKIITYIPFLIGLIAMVSIIGAKQISLFDKGEVMIITSSTLTDAIDISNLSTAQFTYNGIAEVYKDDKKSKIKCYIRYNATVKAGIDMNSVIFDIDDNNKTVKPILPEINITSNTVDEKSLSFIPNDADMNLKDALIACQNDALSESKESSELLVSAEDNLKSIIEALLLPIVTPQEYTIIWD